MASPPPTPSETQTRLDGRCWQNVEDMRRGRVVTDHVVCGSVSKGFIGRLRGAGFRVDTYRDMPALGGRTNGIVWGR